MLNQIILLLEQEKEALSLIVSLRQGDYFKGQYKYVCIMLEALQYIQWQKELDDSYKGYGGTDEEYNNFFIHYSGKEDFFDIEYQDFRKIALAYRRAFHI